MIEHNITRELAIHGGPAVRTAPLPLEFPGVYGIGEEEIEAAVRVLRSRSLFRYYGLNLQRETERFEEELAAFLGVRHALAVGSGTGALHVALSALGVGPGQEVDHTRLPVGRGGRRGGESRRHPRAGRYRRDLLPRSGERGAAHHPEDGGIIMMHMSGAPGDVESVAAIARRRGLFLLEDCAQCAGGSVGAESAWVRSATWRFSASR